MFLRTITLKILRKIGSILCSEFMKRKALGIQERITMEFILRRSHEKKDFCKSTLLKSIRVRRAVTLALRALRSREDLFDIYIQPIPWGQTGWVWEDNEFRQWMDERIVSTQILIQQKQLQPDISLQITIPNEFQKIAPINIGYTAGIETTKVAPQWLQKGNEEVDKILVVSNHAKTTYENTVAQAHTPRS